MLSIAPAAFLFLGYLWIRVLPALLRTDAEGIDQEEDGEENSEHHDDPSRVEEGMASDVVALLPPLLLALPQQPPGPLLLRLVGALLGPADLGLGLLLLVVLPGLLSARHDLETVTELGLVGLEAGREVDTHKERGDVTVLLVLWNAVT